MSYLRLINNPSDEVSLNRVINAPLRGIGQRTLDEVARWARNRDISLYAALEELAGGVEPTGAPSNRLPPRAVGAIAGFVRLLTGLTGESGHLDVVQLIDAVLDRTDYRSYLFDRVDRPEERWENILELRNTAQEFRSIASPDGLTEMLERLALVADVDSYEESPDVLTLITLHQAKGLEFPVVFIVGMEEGLLPHSRSLDSAEELEEERRLCYVGMTRSKERLHLVRAFRRGFSGGNAPSGPSRFLYEIPSQLIASPPTVATRKPSSAVWERPPTTDPEPEPALLPVKTGDKVRHPTFGEGMVVSCVASSQDYEVTVAFDEGNGVKRLLLRYAHLEKVD